MLSSGYAVLAGSEKRSPAVMSTARPTGTTAAIVGCPRGSFLARAEGARIEMRHVVAACRRELAKQGIELRGELAR